MAERRLSTNPRALSPRQITHEDELTMRLPGGYLYLSRDITKGGLFYVT